MMIRGTSYSSMMRKRELEVIFRSGDKIGEEKLNPGSLVSIMLRGGEGWNSSVL